MHFHVFKELNELPNLALAEGQYFEANNLTTYTTLMLDVSSTKLEVHIDYDPNAISRPQAEQMTRFYLATYAAMAANPEARYEAFSRSATRNQGSSCKTGIRHRRNIRASSACTRSSRCERQSTRMRPP